MATQISKKICIACDRLARKNRLSGFNQKLFNRVITMFRLAFVCHHRRKRQILQRIAINLARNKPWHFAHNLKRRWHHIGWQALAQRFTQAHNIGLHIFAWRNKGHKPFHSMVFAQNHSGVFNCCIIGNGSFNFTKFHAKAANLHLVVNAAMK